MASEIALRVFRGVTTSRPLCLLAVIYRSADAGISMLLSFTPLNGPPRVLSRARQVFYWFAITNWDTLSACVAEPISTPEASQMHRVALRVSRQISTIDFCDMTFATAYTVV